MLGRHLVFLDLETTGSNAAHDRITEIGFVEVDRGRCVDEWSTLVNPGIAIPPLIQSLTGITNGMVSAAPAFESLAPWLAQRLAGKVLVAHNARFDYGFLRSEFRRAGRDYAAPVLCTVKLSRRLFPEHRKHNLDALMARHEIVCAARHRALGDAKALWDLAQAWTRDIDPATLGAAVCELLGLPVVPPALPADVFDGLPETPGVYLFYGENDAALYVGSSANLRTQVTAHFSGRRRAANERIAREVRRLDWRTTAGELGALLVQARLVDELRPVHNARGDASRAMRAAPGLPVQPWPYAGPIAVRERDGERCELHLIDRWCYLGTARTEAELHELAIPPREPRFDLSTYRVLARLVKDRARSADIVHLRH